MIFNCWQDIKKNAKAGSIPQINFLITTKAQFSIIPQKMLPLTQQNKF